MAPFEALPGAGRLQKAALASVQASVSCVFLHQVVCASVSEEQEPEGNDVRIQ